MIILVITKIGWGCFQQMKIFHSIESGFPSLYDDIFLDYEMEDTK